MTDHFMTETTEAATGTSKQQEPDMHRFARQTRNATCFLAWLAALVFALSIIGGIIAAVQLSNASQKISNDFTYCQSLGGTDPSC